MTRRRAGILGVVLALVLWAPGVSAVGTVAVASRAEADNVERLSLTLTSTAGGAVSGNTSTIANARGFLVQMRVTPASGGTQPTDLFDLQLLDAASVNLLSDGSTDRGADLSNAASKVITFSPNLYVDGSALDLVLSNAGSAKVVTVTLWIARFR